MIYTLGHRVIQLSEMKIAFVKLIKYECIFSKIDVAAIG